MVVARSQKGMSVLGWLMVLALVAFLASAVFKVVPHYLDNMTLEKLVMQVQTEKALGINTVGGFRGHVAKGAGVNNIRDFDFEKDISIKVANNEFLVHLKYERREPLIRNIDLVVRFDKEFRVRMP